MKWARVEELQGLYGPFSISEKVLQHIWSKQDFCSDGLKTLSGKSLRVIDSGRWNTNEGPDFREARLEIDGVPTVGDVEIHFSGEDWFAHGHDRNENFKNVILEVVLFEPKERDSPVGDHPDSLVLLPLLDHDLESYALETALLELEGQTQPRWMQAFIELPETRRRQIVCDYARSRWSQKVVFARERLHRLGWNNACHQLALEVLGYARNREPMHRIALEYSIKDFAQLEDASRLYDEREGAWRLKGIRPANHPKRRLEQYATICSAHVEWPSVLYELISNTSFDEASSGRDFRVIAGLAKLRSDISSEVFAGCIGEARLNTMMCDAFFPLAGADDIEGAERLWMNWYPGDAPDRVFRFLNTAALVSRESPRSVGLVQGALQLFLNDGAF